MTPPHTPPAVDTTNPSVARCYDAILGGKDNFDSDRRAVDMVLDVCPAVITMARKNRRWLERAVRWLAQDVGMDQFLDVGSGLPTVENTHEVAQRYQPEAMVVYCDNDPTVNAYGRALLATHPRTWFATSDLSRPDEVLRTAEVAQLDFTRPLVLMQCSTLHHVSDEADPYEVMRRYVAALPSGSYVALTHFWDPCDNGADSQLCRELEDRFAETVGSGWWRSREQISRMFDGLELVEPGLVPLADWWPSGPRLDSPEQGEHLCLAAVGRKP